MDACVDVVDASALRRVLPRLLDDPAVQLVEARSQRLVRGDGQGLGVYRVSGAAQVAGESRSWSAIVKVLPGAAGRAADHWCYGERELLAYRSGFVADLAEGLESPSYLGHHRDRAGRQHLWLEDLGSLDEAWSVDTHAWAARCLGRFNGAYLTGVPIPELPWLSRQWLRGWLAETTTAVRALPAHRDHPLVRRVYPPDVAAGIAEVWDHRERLLEALTALPHTLCHNDAFRRNLARRSGHLVGLDWAFVGPGPIGAELSPLISATSALAEVSPDDRDALEHAAVSAYLAGLRETGWRGSADHVWFGYTATSALRYGPGTVRLVLPVLLDASLHDHVAEVLSMPFDAVLDHWAGVIRADTQLYARARQLLT